MKALKLILILIAGGVALNSCTKDPDQIPEREQTHNDSIGTRSAANLLADSIWQKPSVSRLNLLWAHMMEEATVDETGTFIYNNGLFDWKLAKVVKEFEPEHYILSVPTLKHDTLQSILFVAVNNNTYSFFHITKDQLHADTEVLLEQFGPGNLIISIFSFFQYSQVLGSKRAFDFLYTHLTHPELADEIIEIAPRGWCLIEIELYTENQSAEDDENCNCGYYNPITGTQIMNPPTDEHPSSFDDRWELYEWVPGIDEAWYYTNYDEDGTIIHGSSGENGTTVYHFWAWCEDEVGQDPWSYNWATNLEPTGGGGGPINTGPDWSYNKPRWNENTMDCMFAFNHPHATAEINQLEEALLTASCGEAAEYSVKSILDNIVMGLCNEYYDNQEPQDGEVPQFPMNTPHDLNETLNAITSGVEASSYYQIGQQICEVCDNALNPGSCYEAVNNCGAENYEECVKDKLCNFANSSFTSAQNWIMHEYGFDQFTIDNMEPDLLNELLYFNCNSNNIFNPCTGDVIPASIMINSILNSGIPYTLSSFYEELNKEDYIVLGESFSSNEKLKCIWDKIIYSNNDLMCSTLSNYFGGTKINLNLYVQNLIGRNSFTDILSSGSVYISIDQEYIAEACPIEILKTILHEAIHAEILRRHNMYTLAELEQMHPEMMVFFNDPDVSDYHHEYMANEWFDELLDAVISFYPSGFSMEEYETIVWSGLHNTDAFDQTSGITITELNSTTSAIRQNCDKSCE